MTIQTRFAMMRRFSFTIHPSVFITLLLSFCVIEPPCNTYDKNIIYKLMLGMQYLKCKIILCHISSHLIQEIFSFAPLFLYFWKHSNFGLLHLFVLFYVHCSSFPYFFFDSGGRA